MSDDDELPEAQYEGFWSRMTCEACGETFEIDEDVHSGQVVECDACGEACRVVGR